MVKGDNFARIFFSILHRVECSSNTLYTIDNPIERINIEKRGDRPHMSKL